MMHPAQCMAENKHVEDGQNCPHCGSTNTAYDTIVAYSMRYIEDAREEVDDTDFYIDAFVASLAGRLKNKFIGKE